MKRSLIPTVSLINAHEPLAHYHEVDSHVIAQSLVSLGGTFFEALDQTILPERGQLLIHKGDLRHAGRVVSKGTRHILVGFVN